MVKRTMETKAAAQKLRKDLRAMYPDEVAEEDALQEPYRIEEPEPTEVHQLGTRIVSGEHDKRIHNGESGKGGDDQLDKLFLHQLTER